ncbi:hypothetical protein NUSPORA_01339 [Nucleospora cyclopteri]
MFWFLWILFTNLVFLFDHTRNELLTYFQIARNAYSASDLEEFELLDRVNTKLIAKAYKTKKNEVVIAFKGTTLQLLGVKMGETAKKDYKTNRLLFSCAVKNEKKLKKLETFQYYKKGLKIVDKIQKMFPKSKIVLTGHSLGGALASIIASSLGISAICFSSPGEKHAFKSLNIVEKSDKIVHFGMCNDCIYMGGCETSLSACSLAGYQIETRCHLGVSYCMEAPGFLGIIPHTSFFIEKMIKYGVLLKELDNKDCLDCEEYNL